MHQTVTEFLNRVWTSPTINPGMPVAQLDGAIYDLYTPPPAVGVPEVWTQVDYHPVALNQMGWRVYISATAASLMKVWGALQSLFTAQQGVVAAKHTTPAAAATRVDTIVVYLLNATAKDTLITGMRPLFLPRPGIGGAPAIPSKLRPAEFKFQIPPTTQQIPGMQGVSHAQQPIADGWAEQEVPVPALVSFGGQLADMVARAYHGANSKAAFFEAVEANFLEAGMNINSPWQQILSQANRDQLVIAGNSARRRRGY